MHAGLPGSPCHQSQTAAVVAEVFHAGVHRHNMRPRSWQTKNEGTAQMSFHAVEESPLAGVQAAADNGKKDARRKALSSLRVGCSSRVREQQLGSARTAQFFRWDGPSPSSRGLSTPGAPPCSTRRSRASKWMSNGLYQKGRFIVEICTLRAVDIDVRRSLRLLHPHGPCGALAEWRV